MLRHLQGFSYAARHRTSADTHQRPSPADFTTDRGKTKVETEPLGPDTNYTFTSSSSTPFSSPLLTIGLSLVRRFWPTISWTDGLGQRRFKLSFSLQ